jgi:monoterpene epsilon-lactone hydrolase
VNSLQASLVTLLLRTVVKPAIAGGSADLAEIRTRRERLDRMNRNVDAPEGTRFEAVSAGGVSCEWVRPPGGGQDDRVVLYFHGGGYYVGSPALYRGLTWRLAVACDCPLLAVDYRLAPEHPWPAAPDDALAAYRWLLDRGYGGAQVVLGGDSAGGNLALVTLQRIVADGLPRPRAVFLFSPWTDMTGSGGSMLYNARRDPMIPGYRMGDAVQMYAPGLDPADPARSPLFGPLAGLPPLHVTVGSTEALLDDSLRLTDRARAAGVPVELVVRQRLPHVFPLFARVLPEGREAIETVGRWVGLQYARPPETGGPRPGDSAPDHASEIA